VFDFSQKKKERQPFCARIKKRGKHQQPFWIQQQNELFSTSQIFFKSKKEDEKERK